MIKALQVRMCVIMKGYVKSSVCVYYLSYLIPFTHWGGVSVCVVESAKGYSEDKNTIRAYWSFVLSEALLITLYAIHEELM